MLWTLLRRLGQWLRLPGPLADNSTARILHILLLGIAAWLIFLFAVDLPTAPRRAGNAGLDTFLSFIVLAALWLLRRGSLQKASLVYLCGSWLVFTVLIIFNGGIHSVGAVFYVVVPVSAAWLLGYRAAFISAAVCLAGFFVMALLEAGGFPLPRYFPGTPFGIWNALVGALILAAVPVARVLQISRETLARSQAAETALRAQQDNLEELVQQRTAELAAARDQALSANRAKSAFLANMSHELRTPLNAILGFSNLLRERGVTEGQRRDLDIINRSGEHLLGLINDVLDVAKIEAGRNVVERAPCDLSSLVHDVTGMMRLRAAQKDLALLVEASEIPTHVSTDSAKLRQVLINLLSNAIQYTERGSVTLRFTTSPANESERLVLIFEIADTGSGIAAKDQPRIFDAFVQVGHPDLHQGTGLGLTITRQFVELMGGTIQVESQVGVGSRFRVEIPVERAKESEWKASEPERVRGLEAGQPEYRVLIVEDERENSMVLERLLRRAGFQVRVAEDGAKGVEEFQRWRPHFIWMDLRMPVMNGFEATQRVRALEDGRQVKIAAVTASAFAGERSQALAAGLDDLVHKPYRPDEIFECIERHLSVRYRWDRPLACPQLRPEDLAELPDQLCAELREALMALDVQRIDTAIGRVSASHPALAQVLARAASRYSYTTMLDAFLSRDRMSALSRQRAVPG